MSEKTIPDGLIYEATQGRSAEAEAAYASACQPAEADGVVPVVGYLVDVPDEPELGHWYEEEAEEEGEDLGPPLTRCQSLVRQSDHLAALSAVTAERDRLREELESVRAIQIETINTRNAYQWEFERVSAEIEALRPDAERYLWLQESALMGYPSGEGSSEKDAYLVITGYGDEASAAIIDEAIDAAMAAKEG